MSARVLQNQQMFVNHNTSVTTTLSFRPSGLPPTGVLSLLLKILPNRTARLLEFHVPICVYVYKGIVHVIVIVHEHNEIHQRPLSSEDESNNQPIDPRQKHSIVCWNRENYSITCQLFILNKVIKLIIIWSLGSRFSRPSCVSERVRIRRILTEKCLQLRRSSTNLKLSRLCEHYILGW